MSDFRLTTMGASLVSVITNLGNKPNVDNALTAAQLKAKFDEAVKNIRFFINNSLIAELEDKIRELDDAQASYLPDDSITTAKLANAAVTEDKIDIGAITASKIDNGAVWADKIQDHAISNVYTGTLTTIGWTGSASPYTQDVTVNGILATDIPIVDLVPSSTFATAMSEDAAWGTIYDVQSAANKLTFYAAEKPTVALNFNARCIRK